MNNNQKEFTSSFEVTADPTFPPEKIYNFFMSRSIILKDFSLKEKFEDKIIYQAVYISTPEAMSGLESIKVDGLYKGNQFKITKICDNQIYSELVEKYLEEQKMNKHIKYNIKYDDLIRKNFMKDYGTEGLEFINQDLLKKQRGILTYMIKKIGTNLLHGKSIMNVSLPINIFDQRSILETFAYANKYHPIFFSKLDETISNLDRIKTLTAYMIATLSLQLAGTKPFNPILGETFQAKVGDLEMYLEQTCHHPPIFNFYFKSSLFKSYGFSALEVHSSANSMIADNNGKMYIEFKDGTLYKLKPPKMQISGLMLGRRYVNYIENLAIEDLTNNIISVINFTKEQKSFLSKMFSSFKLFPDYVTGFVAKKPDVQLDSKSKIYKITSGDGVMAKFEGEWSNYFKIDDHVYWRQGDYELPELEKMSFTLPSDSTLRPDVILLKNGHEEFAQIAKIQLEEVQRNDKKLRENYKKSSNKN